jgi:uncharacterized protein (TIGR02001 family)
MLTIFLMILISLGFSSSAQADNLYSTTSLSSNYIYRGLSFYNNGSASASAGQSVIQESVNYLNNGFNLGAFFGQIETFNVDKFQMEKDVEMDVTASYKKKVGEVEVGMGVYRMSYLKNGTSDMFVFDPSVSYKFVKVEEHYFPNYAGLDTNLYYSKLGLKPYLTDKIFLVAHFGYAHFSDNKKIYSSNYADYKAGAGFSLAPEGITGEVAYTNTLNRLNYLTGLTSKQDNAVTISISKSFQLY